MTSRELPSRDGVKRTEERRRLTHDDDTSGIKIAVVFSLET